MSFTQLPQRLVHPDAGEAVEGSERLFRERELWLAGEGHPLLFAAGGGSATHRGGDTHQIDGPPLPEPLVDPHAAEATDTPSAFQGKGVG
uniref:hypothetical protein n=1 Tax=Streptomyces tabacisoli TaxID=3156398 RepID=UPI003EBC1771